eukprot:6191637-Pleurochrysis_carterae.AAC.2
MPSSPPTCTPSHARVHAPEECCACLVMAKRQSTQAQRGRSRLWRHAAGVRPPGILHVELQGARVATV